MPTILPLLLATLLAQPDSVAPPQGTRRNATVIMSTDERSRQFQDEWGYSDATAAGGFVFLSGVVAALRPGEMSFEPAYTRAFEQIGNSLRRLGCSWGDVVEITSFHTDLSSQMPAIVAVKRRYVGPPYPAWTAVGVTRLIPNSGITEIRATAMCKVRPQGK
jgi:enamine deaminase RidA (YjgF/YER057c/UK114 family)